VIEIIVLQNGNKLSQNLNILAIVGKIIGMYSLWLGLNSYTQQTLNYKSLNSIALKLFY